MNRYIVKSYGTFSVRYLVLKGPLASQLKSNPGVSKHRLKSGKLAAKIFSDAILPR